MSKKSAAQLRRMQKRAESRGDTYEIPAALLEEQKKVQKLKAACKLREALEYLEENKDGLNSKEKRSAKRKAEAIAVEESGSTCTIEELMQWHAEEISQNATARATSVDHSRIKAFTKYQETLTIIESNEDLKSKDRRSAKRRADAIACEESKFENIQDFIKWHEENKDITTTSKAQTESRKRKAEDLNGDHSKKMNPYILFVGQIPYNCTADGLFDHFQKYMGKKTITKDSLQIRIPAEDKEKAAKRIAKKSEEKDEVAASSRNKGFAFAEFQDPELMYECLKLHHTDLDGRRINVLRSAGGGKASRAEKIKLRQKEQEDYISSTVDKIIEDYISKGELQEGELDEGAILLCKRRSAAIVEASLSQYIVDRGDRDLENPSSFFSRIICRVTEEGIDSAGNSKKPQQKRHRDSRNQEIYPKRGEESSVLRKQGVDMSIGENIEANTRERGLTSIFPSMGRGRGRGRGGYM